MPGVEDLLRKVTHPHHVKQTKENKSLSSPPPPFSFFFYFFLFFYDMTFKHTVKELNSWSVFKIGSYERKGGVEIVKIEDGC